MSRDFYHTGLQVSRSDIESMRSNLNPFQKLYVNKGSGVASPFGDIYKGGSDYNDGLTWGTAFATIAKAISVARGYTNWSASPWAPNVEIHIAPGSYAESLTALPHGCHLIGYGEAWDADGETGVRIKPASGAAIDVGAFVNAKVSNINFEVADASRVFDATILNNVQFEHCRFAGPPEATTATAGIYTNATVALTVRDCKFEYLDAGIDIVYSAASASTMVRCLIDGNYFSWISEAGIRFGAANLLVRASFIVNNFIHGGGATLAIGIDDNSGDSSCQIARNVIGATTGIDGEDLGSETGGNYVNGVLE